jgi:cation diffusion facilitator CzcD-associated flavoprotein CzcO
VWITQNEPRFLPDHVDGRFLFDAATQVYEAKKQGRQYKAPSLGDIVMVESVKEARGRKALKSLRPFERFSRDSLIWANGHEEKIDVVIFCTGFRASLGYLSALDVINADGKVDTDDTRATAMDGLWLVGYGNWTGFASATLIGVGRTAKTTVDQIKTFLGVTV